MTYDEMRALNVLLWKYRMELENEDPGGLRSVVIGTATDHVTDELLRMKLKVGSSYGKRDGAQKA